MKKLFSIVLLLALALSMGTVAFGSTSLEGEYDLAYYTKYKGQGLSVNVYNWGEYISNGDNGSLDVNAAFEELTGIRVVYNTFDTNEILYAKLKTGGSNYDVIIPSDYTIARMLEEDMLRPLNFDNIPNFRYIDPQYVNPGYDSQNRFSVPYTWGTVGLIYNTTMVEPGEDMETWDVLWNEKYSKNILMFGNSRDAFAIAFKRMGAPLNAETKEQLDEGTRMLIQQKPLVQAYVMDEIFDKMTGGEAAIAPYYAGDFITMHGDNPDLAFAFPREGTNIFTDAMCIPKDAKNPELAEMYINFMLEPQVGLSNIEYIGYSTPNTAVFELLDDEIKSNPVQYPPKELLDTFEYLVHPDPQMAKAMDDAWTSIVASDQAYSDMVLPGVLILCVGIIVVLSVMRAMKKKRPQG